MYLSWYCNKIARLNTDGTFDTSFVYGSLNGFNSDIKVIKIQSDGKILVGGNFTTYNDTSSSYNAARICRLNTDGTFDTSFTYGPGYGFSDVVHTIEIQSDGYILVGGDFTGYNDSFGAYDTNRICRLNTVGNFDTSFVYGPSYGFNDSVLSITLQPNGNILVGGKFTNYNDYSSSYDTNKICRLQSNGYFDTSFLYGSSYNICSLGSVWNITLQPDDKILVGGNFYQYCDYISSYDVGSIFRLNTDGTLDTQFNTTGTGFEGGDSGGPVVYTMVLDAAGKLTIGGNFTVYNGSPAPSIVRMYSQIILTYVINNKELRLIVKYTKLQKYDLITTPMKISAPRGSYDNKFVKLLPSDFNENFEQIVVNNLSHNKRKQLRPGSAEIYLAFYDLNTKKTSLIPNYKIVTTRYGDNEVFRLIRGNVVINSVAP